MSPKQDQKRVALVIGSGSTSFEMIRALVDRLPVMVTPRCSFALDTFGWARQAPVA